MLETNELCNKNFLEGRKYENSRILELLKSKDFLSGHRFGSECEYDIAVAKNDLIEDLIKELTN